MTAAKYLVRGGKVDENGFAIVNLYEIQPPKHCPRYRRWRVWYDAGHYEHGITYRITQWCARSPAGVDVQMRTHADIKAHIDDIEDRRALEHELGPKKEMGPADQPGEQ